MSLPGEKAYPSEIKGLRPQPCQITGCRKCRRARTRVAYVDDAGRAWPTCRDCAIAAVRVPCSECGYVGPGTRAMEQMPEGGHRTVLRHDNGRQCFPLDVREEHAVPCSSCGAELRLAVTALPAVIHGTSGRIACACGAAWQLESRTRPGVNVYVSCGS